MARAGILDWLREHILASIIGAALVATLSGWFGGFFDSILHDSKATDHLKSVYDSHCNDRSG